MAQYSFYWSSTFCKEFHWDYLVAFRLFYKIMVSHTHNKPSSVWLRGHSGTCPFHPFSIHVHLKSKSFHSSSPSNYSLKLLWAPLVDSFYHTNFGRRKSWLIPVQYLIGVCLFTLSYNIDSILGSPPVNNVEGIPNKVVMEPGVPRVYLLAVIFFVINFLCATQDIAVDGWALTMLSKRNVVYGSTCNTVGQTVGFTLGYLVFLALESPEVCNRYFRSIPQPDGMVTLAGK